MSDLGTKEVYDEAEDNYDRKHGSPAKGKDHECANLTEAQNKEPPQYNPMKNLRK